MARVSSEEAGTRTFETLASYYGGLSTMLALRAGLSESQVTRGLEWMRDLFDEYEPVIRNWVGREWVYKLPNSERDCREHMERDLRSQVTRARRDYNRFHGIAKKHPSPDAEYQAELARRRLVDLRYAYEKFQGQEPLAA